MVTSRMGLTSGRIRLSEGNLVGLASLFGALVRSGLVAVLLIWIAEVLGVYSFGLFSGAIAIARLVAPLTSTGSTWEVQSRLTSGDPLSGLVAPILLRMLLLVLFSTLVTSGALVVLNPEISVLAGMAIVTGAILPQGVRAVVQPVLLIEKRAVLVFGMDASRGLVQVFFVGVALSEFSTLAAVSVSYLVSNTLWSLLVLTAFVRHSTPDWRRWRGWRENANEALVVSGTQGMRSASYSVDQTMMPRLASPSAVGQYALAAQAVSFGVLAIGSLGEARQPALYARARIGSSSLLEAAAVQARQLQVVALVLSCFAVLGSFAASLILQSFDSTVVWLTATLSVSVVLVARGYPFAYGLTAAGLHKTRQKAEASALVVNVILNIAAISAFGAVGAALATIGSEALLAQSTRVLLTRREVAG